MFELGDRVVIRSVNDSGGFPSMNAMMMLGETGEITLDRGEGAPGFRYWIALDNDIEEGNGTWACNADEIELESK